MTTNNEEFIQQLENAKPDLVAAYEEHLKKADELVAEAPQHLKPTYESLRRRIESERDVMLESLDNLIDIKK